MTISRRQAGILRRQIRNLQGRRWIALRQGHGTATLGDIIARRRGNIVLVDGGELPAAVTDNPQVGKKINREISTTSTVTVDFKAAGVAPTDAAFPLTEAEAGITVSFTSKKSMFLKLLGLREEAVRSVPALAAAVAEQYTRAQLGGKVYVVTEILKADSFYLQFGREARTNVTGELVMGFSAPTGGETNPRFDTEFSVKRQKSVGAFVDGLNGGILAYRVKKLRLTRSAEASADALAPQLLSASNGSLDILPLDERSKLLSEDGFELVDATDEFLLEELEELEELEDLLMQEDE